MARNKHKNVSLPHVQLPWEVLNSKAYMKLKPSAAKALPYFIGKVKLPFNDPAKNHTKFSFTYPEAVRLGFAKSTYFTIIENLIECGFVNPKEKGGLRGNGKSSSIFTLSSRWKDYGTKEFVNASWKEFV